ncbi:MAG TPA: hypothetical protein VJ984_04495 [Xanthomonadales bacterium]|nr:hypothetical protein [Xanthomonadales bacterium]
MSEQTLLMISRDDILAVADGPQSKDLFRLLAWLTRNDFHLLATATMPDHSNSRERWLKGGGDADLFGPDSIRSRIDEAGGTLDGVYYVPRSLLSQNKNRINSLGDMMQRYKASPNTCYLFSSSRKWAQAALQLGIQATALDKSRQLIAELTALKEKASS